MKIEFDSGLTVEYKEQEESWHTLLLDFLKALQAFGYCLKDTPDEMLNKLIEE